MQSICNNILLFSWTKIEGLPKSKRLVDMVRRSIKRKLVKARIILNQTIQKILEINHNRKRLRYLKNAQLKEADLNQELKILNKIAAQQARLIRHYEDRLYQQD